MGDNFKALFAKRRAIIGTIHLGGNNSQEKIERALQEVQIYQREGLVGAMIGNYHSGIEDVEDCLDVLEEKGLGIPIGINTLSNPLLAFEMARRYSRVKFIQIDSFSETQYFDLNRYKHFREQNPEIVVFGGVQLTGNHMWGALEEDLREVMPLCDAIVTTEPRTGARDSLKKLKYFRDIIGRFPLVVVADIKLEEIRAQLRYADGAIVGKYFRNGNTRGPVDVLNVRKLIGR